MNIGCIESPSQTAVPETLLESTSTPTDIYDDAKFLKWHSNSSEIIENKVPKIPLITTDKRYNRIGNEKNIEELSKEIQELQIKITEYVRKNPIVFARQSFEFTKNSQKTFEMIVDVLAEFENIRIEVAGHTDAAGAASYNQSISQKRAQAVKDKLITLGIEFRSKNIHLLSTIIV